MTGQPFYLQFFNLQYWYCLIYSIFGGHCATVPGQDGFAPAPAAQTTFSSASVPAAAPSAAAQGGSGGADFFSWLFGSGGTGVQHTGFFGPLFDLFAFVFGIVGVVLSFVWALYSIVAYLVSLALLIVIVVSVVGLFVIRAREAERYGNLPPDSAAPSGRADRWRPLLQGAMTTDPRQWKEGILAADRMLGELLATIGYAGQATGDALARVPDNAFVSLPAAREAHAAYEKVAGPGADFILTQREAFRVMKLYEQVFDEFHFV